MGSRQTQRDLEDNSFWQCHQWQNWRNEGTRMQADFPSKPIEASHSVMSNSLWPHGLWPARLLCPWHSPDKNTGLRAALLHCRQILYHLSHQGSPLKIYITVHVEDTTELGQSLRKVEWNFFGTQGLPRQHKECRMEQKAPRKWLIFTEGLPWLVTRALLPIRPQPETEWRLDSW